jgi:exopolysaccharide biosynthesis polyprenyl glycosylphosphotransferase
MQASAIDTSAFSGQAVQAAHPSLGLVYGLLKRSFDVVVTLFGGLCVLPCLLLVAILIKLDSAGPVLYRQRRIGLNGREFWMYKFRSMHVGAEAMQDELMAFNEMDGPLFKMRNDPRVTRVGRIIRRCSVDEFPQLINVLRGEMSLVGPRPPLPREVAEFEPWQMEKFVVRPGMTGLWQVSGRNEVSEFLHMIRLDVEYVRSWSLWLDLRILMKTFVVVFRGMGAF